ncbi:MAG: polyphosphate kinase 1 [Mariniblastus sp.]|nr:polyphosphate kinase 1 [Mariniblastus sp.]
MKKPKSNYLNRELSWLAFNQRVLDQASREAHPLLERVKFLAISAANLNEFFMVRVGGLKMVSDSSSTSSDIAGFSADEQLELIRARVRKMLQTQSKCLLEELEPELELKGIHRLRPNDLSDTQRELLLERFREETLSTLAPIAVQNADDFPMLAGARLCMCVRLKNEIGAQIAPPKRDSELSVDAAAERSADRYLLLPFGRSPSRFWTLPSEKGYRYILFEDVLRLFLAEMFANQEIIESSIFRITRNGDVALVEDRQADLLTGMKDMLDARRISQCVRLEVSDSISDEMIEFLQNAIDVAPCDTYRIEGPLALADYFALSGIKGFSQLQDKPWPPQPSPEFSAGKNIFETIAAGDKLLYHPYQSYEPVISFVAAAASDPDVIAIKQTLYRTSSDSKIVEALETAAANGKHVTAIVELKARFDEARNIKWAKHLENAGVDVIYGVRGLKTHAKMSLVVRRETTGIKRYMHFGTGNYNEATARIYSDVSLFTSDEQLGSDAVHFFNAITGLSVPQAFSKLVAAPINLRETLLKLVKVETESAKNGGSGQITAKINSLVDKDLIDALYAASQAGVKIRLNVRGICCLVPGKKGLSENIKVVSVVDRLLEHARVFYFEHGGDEKLFISSADWMGRNLDRRVELMIPVEESACKSRLLKILRSYFDDNFSAMELQTDGTYQLVVKKKKKGINRTQQMLYEEACQIHAAHTNPRTTVFEPHRNESN